MALIVLDPVPVEVSTTSGLVCGQRLTRRMQTINTVLASNKDNCEGAQYLWLADRYENLPDYSSGVSPTGTTTPVNVGW